MQHTPYREDYRKRAWQRGGRVAYCDGRNSAPLACVACLVFVFGLVGFLEVPIYLTIAVLPIILTAIGIIFCMYWSLSVIPATLVLIDPKHFVGRYAGQAVELVDSIASMFSRLGRLVIRRRMQHDPFSCRDP